MNARWIWLSTALVIFSISLLSAQQKKPAKPEPAPKPQVKFSGVHNCCGGCKTAIAKAVQATGAGCEVGESNVTIHPTKYSAVTITAANEEGLKKAVQALADAGYHGKSDREDLQMPDDSGFKLDGQDTVQGLTVHVAHNCCRKCSQALVVGIKKVPGAQPPQLEGKETQFRVGGSFTAQTLVKALNEIGFHVKVSK